MKISILSKMMSQDFANKDFKKQKEHNMWSERYNRVVLKLSETLMCFLAFIKKFGSKHFILIYSPEKLNNILQITWDIE